MEAGRTQRDTLGEGCSALGGMLLRHAEGHLPAELCVGGRGEEESFVLTGAHSLEVGLWASHHLIKPEGETELAQPTSPTHQQLTSG